MNLRRAISGILAVLLAVQPAWAVPCACSMACRDAMPEQASARKCCHEAVTVLRLENVTCPCCQSTCLCAAKAKSRDPLVLSSRSQRAAAKELMPFAFRATVISTGLLAGVRSEWEAGYWTVSFASAPQRCKALCRWLL